MTRSAWTWLAATIFLGLVLFPAPALGHGNHQTATQVTCNPNPVVRGNSATCTLRVNDIASSQNAQPIGTLNLYRGSVAPANLLGSCPALGIPNQTASNCPLTYTPPAAGTETLIADFVNTAAGADPHQWCSSSQTTGGCGGTTRGTTSLVTSPAPAASLRIVQSPNGQPANTTAGVAIQRVGGGGVGVQVEVLNTLGERMTGSTLSVTMAIQTNAGGGALSGTLTRAAVNGVATFDDLSINRAGIGYTLRATGAGVTGVTTTAFNITAAAANRFAFAQQPGQTIAGQTIGGGTGVTARVEDQFGNVVNTDNATQITVAILANPGGGTLTGTLTRTAVNGVATFNDLSINRSGVGYTLQATGSLSPGTSLEFDIVAGNAAQVAFGIQPATTTAGQIIGGGGGVTARIEDGLGNLITSSTAAVTIALAANPGATSLQGTLTVAAVNGVATFSNLVITVAASGYTLSAASPGLVGTTSSAFTITSSPAVRLSYGQPPTNNEADAPITPAITVRIEDGSGNLVDDSRIVTIALAANPGSTTLQGTLSRAAVNGVATFNDVVIDVAAAGYTLAATTTGGLTSVTSSPFSIAAGAPTRLAFNQQPSNVAAGSLIAPAVTVRILDTPGNVVTSATQTVTVSIQNNPAGGTLSGTVSVAAVNGVATFSTLSINRAGTGYTLAANATSLAAAASNAFDVAVGTPTQLQFMQQPTNTVAGQSIASLVGGVQVRVLDASGNVVTTSSAPVTLSIEFDAGGASTALNGTTTVNAVNGIATFPNLSINIAGTGYTLRASSGALTNAISSGFNIMHAAASKLAFGVHPANTTAGATITPAPTVRVLDAFNNLVTNSSASVALAFGNNPGGGALGGNVVANAVNGVATFSNLSINRSGAGYTLSANSSGLAGVTSNAFNVSTGPASRLSFTVQPSTVQLLETISPAVRVAVEDAFGNTVTTSTANVSLVLDNNPGGGELGGTVTVAAVAGVATFNNLFLDRTGNGYTLQANSSGVTSTLSTPFDILVGPPAQLAFEQQPMNTAPATAMTPWPSVRVQDAAGNPVPSTAQITISRGNPGGTCGGALSGTTQVNATSGVATFSTLQIATAGTGCTLVATSPGLTGATSNAFNVLDPGFTFTSLSPVSGPSGGGTVVTITGSGFGSQTGRYQVIFGKDNPAPPVTANRDSNSILTVDTPAHPPGLVNVAVIDTQTGGTRALQNAYTYISQPPTKMVFGNQPTNITAGGMFSPLVTVQIVDTNGNIVNNATTAVTIAFHTNTAGGTLLGTKTVNAFNGVATFSTLSVDKAGAGYRLVATAPGLDPTPASNPFAVTAGSPAKLAFAQNPTNNDPGVPITPSVTVEIRDEHDNRVAGDTSVVEMAIGINAGAGVLSGGTTVAAVDGVATFNSISLDKAGNGYTLIATSGSLAQAESATFDIRFGAPARVQVTTHPGNGVAGSALTPAIVAEVVDNQGNVVADFTDPVNVTIHTNPGGSTLTGTLTAAPVNGVATFSDVRLDKVGLAYRLAANAFGLESGLTNPFDISNAAASALQFTVQPGDVSQNSVITPSPEVRVIDAFGNHVPTATHAITLAIGNNPGGGALGGTVTRNAVAGVVTFNNLTINAGGDGYTLVASASPTLTTGTSASFNVIGAGGTLNIFSPCTGIDTTAHPTCPIAQGRASNATIGYLPTIVGGEEFCVDMVRVNAAGTGTENYNATVTLQMLDASVNTGSLLPGNCRSSWTVIKEWTGIQSTNADQGRVRICGLVEGNVWPQVRFRAFHTQGQAGVGCSTDAFAIRPDFFELSTILVSDDDWQTAGTERDLIIEGTPSASGGPVHAAGRPFRVQVTAINKQGQPTTNYDGKPRIEVIERLLPETCTGCPTPTVQSTGWGQSAGVPGAVRTNQAVFHDAGVLRIRIVDETFSSVDQVDIDLGLQPADSGVIASNPLNIGRFVPDNFVVAPVSTPQLRTQGIAPATCSGSRSFTYLGQGFGYATLPSAQVSARSASGAITPGYRGALWKLTPDKVLQEYTDNTNPADSAQLNTSMAPLLAGNATLTTNNDGTGVLTVNAADRLSYDREPLVPTGDPLQMPDPPEPFAAFISLTMRVFDDAETAVVGNEQINTGTPGVFANMAFDSGNTFRYGRLRLINAVGSELVPLEVPYRLQTWQDVGNGIKAWVTETQDNCTPLEMGQFSILDVQQTGIGGLVPEITMVDSPASAGLGNLTFGAQDPAVTGSFDVFGGTVPSYLWFNWTSDPGGDEVGPTAKAAFGVNEGNPRRIFRTQSFTPRAN